MTNPGWESGNFTDVMSIPASVARLAYQAASTWRDVDVLLRAPLREHRGRHPTNTSPSRAGSPAAARDRRFRSPTSNSSTKRDDAVPFVVAGERTAAHFRAH